MCEPATNTPNIVRVDQKILQHMSNTDADFLMEVTNKTKADVKVSLSMLSVLLLNVVV